MSDRIAYLQSLPSVRERCSRVYSLAQQDRLDWWTLHEGKAGDIIDFCCSLIARDYGTDYAAIPPHGRWRHFLAGSEDRIAPLLSSWSAHPPLEVARRMVDLFVVAVLLDAGAGDAWRFTEPVQGAQPLGRSEGLAVAALWAFKAGVFSGDPNGDPMRADAEGLAALTVGRVAEAMQSRPGNEMAGLEGRAGVLRDLGRVLAAGSACFPAHAGLPARPGNLVDYLLAHPVARPLPGPVLTGKIEVPLEALWEAVVSKQGLAGAWPEEGRAKVDGVVIGDVWECGALKRNSNEADGWVSFHKLSQWLTYSLIEVLEKTMGWHITGKEAMTGLPEYRNGGLLIDYGYLTPKLSSFAVLKPPGAAEFSLSSIEPLAASHPAIIEWRALTVVALDGLHKGINEKLGAELELAQVLEAATWKGGREAARRLRGEQGGGPPFGVLSDGTVF